MKGVVWEEGGGGTERSGMGVGRGVERNGREAGLSHITRREVDGLLLTPRLS